MGEEKTNLFGKIVGKIWGNWAEKQSNEWLKNLYKNEKKGKVGKTG